MSHTFHVSDEQYAEIFSYAQSHDETPETLFQAWVSEVVRQEAQRSRAKAQMDQKEKEADEEGPLDLLQIAGIFSVGEPGWADRHDEVFGMTQVLTTDHHFEQAGFVQVPKEARRYR